ncbi:ead/Ea22-like family protein [Escherichia coli]|nr:ead/Ea22-like family protein [Escherichia coli]MCW3424423.1 ead/Ea22-like family protein [Escherichia coli]HEB0311749.1 ead/Ea22-like family protein [Escherichia coli]
MSKIDYQALREKAEKATCGVWSLEYGDGRFDGDDALIHREAAGYIPICRIEGAHPESGFDEDFQIEQQANAEFIAAANPATVLALLDERERNQQYIKLRDQENEDIALTVGKLRVELEGKDSKIANLTAERDALREGEMGDARHSNTRSAADIYFQLVEECEIPAGGSLVEYVDDMREKLEAAEKRIAELEAEPVSQTYKLNELSGNSPVTPDGWISCSERMPEETGDIIVVSDGIVMSGISYSRRDGFYIAALEYDDDEPIGGVTHWMPLPEPPRLKEL